MVPNCITRRICIIRFNSFKVNVPFLYPLKTWENVKQQLKFGEIGFSSSPMQEISRRAICTNCTLILFSRWIVSTRSDPIQIAQQPCQEYSSSGNANIISFKWLIREWEESLWKTKRIFPVQKQKIRIYCCSWLQSQCCYSQK